MIYRYEISQDTRYAWKVYPYLRGVAEFWEKDLVLRDGVYHVVGDGMHERTDGNIRENGVPEDPVNTLGVSENIFLPGFQKISEALELDEEKTNEVAGNCRKSGAISKGNHSGNSGQSYIVERSGCEAGGFASPGNAG